VEDWSQSKNEEVFGNCANPNWHGHNYDLFVTVKGKPDPTTGMIINVRDLKKIIRREVIELLDHKNLNMDVSFMQGVMPTIENLAKVIWQRLQPHMDGYELHRVKVHETENIFAEYYGE
jgi:6-pyruvoyltetrahydropterin/6-carboxytetrahydropterin synthase